MNQKLKLFTTFCIAFSVYASAQDSQNEQAAKNWIKSHSRELDIKSYHDFKLRFSRKSLAGETLRLQETINNVPVFDAEIVVHFSPKNEITDTESNYDSKAANINTIPSITEQAAIAIANKALNVTGEISFQECKLYVYNKLPETKLVYRVVTNSEFIKGSWETIVDAKTAEVLSKKDIAKYHTDPEKTKPTVKKSKKDAKNGSSVNSVTGTALIYNPDPLSVAQHNYSGAYVDGNDATNASLDAARTAVVLPEIELLNGVYKLKGTYAEIKSLEAPSTGLFTQATSDFSFNRNQQGFEAVNAYYHIDNSLRYINETLGIVCIPLNHNGILWYDPHAVQGDDQSYYSSGELHFGEGGVDDAEDADVILHELGHGIHDWITGGSASDNIGEGNGDYWAASYSRSLNQWAVGSDEYNYMFNWDGHNPFWDGRMTNTTKVYPTDLDGEVHDDGEIWAAALLQIYDEIGKTKMDKAFLEGLALTTSTTNQQNAARKVRQAAIDMNYSCADIQSFTTNFTNRGYVMPALPLTVTCPGDQTVDPDTSGNYNVADFTGLSNAISNNCDAIITQSPTIGTILTEGTYPVTMTAVSGTSTKVCSFNLIVNSALGINNSKDFASIYPNPSTSIITIKGNFASSEKVAIYNMLGQKVLENTISNDKNTIDVSKLTNGVYSIYFESSKFTSKFVKN